jgi:hypothetical protein
MQAFWKTTNLVGDHLGMAQGCSEKWLEIELHNFRRGYQESLNLVLRCLTTYPACGHELLILVFRKL